MDSANSPGSDLKPSCSLSKEAILTRVATASSAVGASPIPAADLQLSFAAVVLAGRVLLGLSLIVAGAETVPDLPDLQPVAVFGRLATSPVS